MPALELGGGGEPQQGNGQDAAVLAGNAEPEGGVEGVLVRGPDEEDGDRLQGTRVSEAVFSWSTGG